MLNVFDFIQRKSVINGLLSFFILLAIALSAQSCQEKKQLKPEKPNNTAEVKRLTIIADRQYEENKYDSASYNYNKIISLADPKKDREDYLEALISMGYIYYSEGNYIQGEAIAIKTFPHLQYMKNPRFAWNVYNILGINYLGVNDYENSLLYFKKALQLKTKPWRKLSTLSNVGLLYMQQHKFKRAANIYIKITTQGYYADKKKSKTLDHFDYYEYSRMTDNLGFCLFKLGNPKALDYYFEALEIKLKINDSEGLPFTYNHLSEFYLLTNPNLAKQYAKISYATACKVNAFETKVKSLNLLINSSEGNDLKKYSLTYIKLIDSFTVAGKKAKNEFARIRYDSNKEKTENLELKTQKTENELQLERQKNRNIILYIIIIFVASVILFLYFDLSLKGKKGKNEAIYTSEMRISKKLHDELANDVYHTMAFVENKNVSLEENKEHLLKNLDDIYSRTRDISKENSSIITDENYPASLKEMISGFKTSNINLLLNGFETILWHEVDKNKKIVVYRVLQELLVNMKKHSNASLVGITFKKNDNTILINYIDNGNGIDINKMTQKNGLHNIENRILAIKGDIDIDSSPEKGFKVFIKFPL